MTMTETERLSKQLALVSDALEFVRDCAQQDRKLSIDKHVSGHYTIALTQLQHLQDVYNTRLKRAQNA